MLKIAICDDEKQIGNVYQTKLETILNEQNIIGNIECFTDSEAFYELMDTARFDIILLDIDMPEISGLQIAQKMNTLQHKPILIFVTCHDALVYQSFQYHPFGFIRKSYFDEEINDVLLQAMQYRVKEKTFFVFTFENETVKTLLSDILYFESNGNYLMLYTKNKTYKYRSTLSEVERELSEQGFIRIHKGFIVNSKEVYRIGNNEITLTSGTELPIGRSNKETVRQTLMRCLTC
jgi:DNA-binding LytR/AlgR family response regulator